MSRFTPVLAGLLIGSLVCVPLSAAKTPGEKKPSKAQLRKAEKEAAMQSMIAKAEAGDAEALMIVGSCHFKGKGVAKDPAKGLQYLEASSAKGWKEADAMLLDIYKNGRYGIAKDEAKAEALYTKMGIASPNKQKAAFGEMKKQFDAFLASDDERAKYINKGKAMTGETDLRVIASMVVEGTALMEKAHQQRTAASAAASTIATDSPAVSTATATAP